MTGFGRATTAHDGLNLVAEVSSVNQRGLAVVAHVPQDWPELEPRLGAVIRGAFQRGKVTLRLTATRAAADAADLSEPLRKLRELARRHQIAGEPDWHVLLRLVERQEGAACLPTADEHVAIAAEDCLRQAIKACDAMRSAEGQALTRDLSHRVDSLGGLVGGMESSEREAPRRARDRLVRRLSDLGVGVDVGDERVLRELAIHADRCDISEEITRLRSHLQQAQGMLLKPGAGRGLDFLTQEFLREVNTIGSKAAEVETTRLVLEAKAEIERIREQVQNLE